MKVLVVLALGYLAVASLQIMPAQFNFGMHHKTGGKGKNIVLDYVHNYRFEEHKKRNHSLLIAISDIRQEKQCHVIEIDAQMTRDLRHYDIMQNVTEEIYNLIDSGAANERQLNHSQVFKGYHDQALVKACRRHKTFAMDYTPSFEYEHVTHKPHHGNHHNTHKPHHGKHHSTHKPHHGKHHSTHKPHHGKHHSTHKPHHGKHHSTRKPHHG